MKKYLLVSLTVLFAAAFLWADDAVVQLPEPKIDIEGEGNVEWGVDLGSGTGPAKDRAKHGFKNSASWKVKFPLIKKGDMTSSKTDVPVYGEVILKDVELNIQSKHDANDKNFGFDGKVDGLKAKFVFYGAYLTVHGAPDFKTNYAALWKPLKEDNFDEDKHGFKFGPGFGGAGFKLGYANKNLMDLDVGLKFGSNGDWTAEGTDGGDEFVEYKLITTEMITKAYAPTATDADKKAITVETGKKWVKTANGVTVASGMLANNIGEAGEYKVYKVVSAVPAVHSKYGIGFDFSIKPLDKMLGIAFKVNSTFGTAQPHQDDKGYRNGVGSHVGTKNAVNFGTEITSEPIDALKFKLGFDGGYAFAGENNKDVFAWDLLFNTEYKWVSGGVYVASEGTPYHGYNNSSDDSSKWKENTADMALYLKFETKGDKKEASNLVEGLDAGVYVGLYRLLSKKPKDSKAQLPVLMKVWGEYKANITDSMWIKPFAHIWAETNHQEQNNNTTVKKPYIGVAYDLGVTYSPVEKVEITAKWAHGKVAANTYPNREGGQVIKAKANANKRNHNGTFTLGVKVKY